VVGRFGGEGTGDVYSSSGVCSMHRSTSTVLCRTLLETKRLYASICFPCFINPAMTLLASEHGIYSDNPPPDRRQS